MMNKSLAFETTITLGFRIRTTEPVSVCPDEVKADIEKFINEEDYTPFSINEWLEAEGKDYRLNVTVVHNESTSVEPV